LYIEGVKLVIREAPEPWGINWKNLHFTVTDKCLRRAVSLFFTLVVLGIGSYVLLLLEKLGDSADDNVDTDTGAYIFMLVLPYISAIAIEIINGIIADVIISLANKEAYSTKTRY